MTVRVFVDSNVLVHARDRTDEEKHTRALEWLAALWEERAGRLSWQMLEEYYVTATRSLDPPRDTRDVREDIASLAAWRPIPVELPIIDAAWDLEDRFGLSWWDALMVAAALADGCSHLLTERLDDGRTFDGVTVVNPFVTRPEEVLGRSAGRV